MIKCMIVDDEPLAIDVLKRYVEATPGLALTNAFVRPLDAFHALQQHPPDLIFIDIQMPEITGLELIKTVKNPPAVILTTAHRDFAVDAFEINALDYLVKPISKERFLKAIAKYNATYRTPAHPHDADRFIFLKVDKEMVNVHYDEILYIEALKNYSRIRMLDKEFIVYYTLSYLTTKLPENEFMRIHKSYIINTRKIKKYTTDQIEINGTTISIGKTYQLQFEQLLKGKTI